MAIVRGLAAFLATTLAVSTAGAREFRVDEIPNGDKRRCLNCHLTADGEHFSPFGSDVKFSLVGDGLQVQEQHVDWAAVFAFDSDGDTFTNGEELLDPLGTWTIGAPDPPGVATNPGDSDSHPPGVCDNGVLEPDEDCDTGQMRVSSCAELGLGDGAPICGAQCAFDLSSCSELTTPTSGEASPEEGGGCAVSTAGGAQDSDEGLLLAALTLLLTRLGRRR